MTTPVWDFVREYAKKETVRLHMPGHKGVGETERYDLTEIDGADSLYEASGIIRESEENAGRLFGAVTFYSTEGSSHAIRAMLFLASLYARSVGRPFRVAAGRNVHKSFVGAAALLDATVDWLAPAASTYLSCPLTAADTEAYLAGCEQEPACVYVTSPDYLGNTVDVAAIARVCHEKKVLLLVDNAHGAYSKFLPVSRHPMDLGADMCADSAHKTLPALTGAAYLHIAKDAPSLLAKRAKGALALFGSTSPSYLILASLDKLNASLEADLPRKLSDLLSQLQDSKKALAEGGYGLVGDEPMKLTLATKPYGYTGKEVAAFLTEKGIVPEYADEDFLVLMPTPETAESLAFVCDTLLSLPRKAAIQAAPPPYSLPKRVMSPKEAMCAEEEEVPVEAAVGRVLASITVGCPPAVPVAISGERIDESTLAVFRYYGIKTCMVVKE